MHLLSWLSFQDKLLISAAASSTQVCFTHRSTQSPWCRSTDPVPAQRRERLRYYLQSVPFSTLCVCHSDFEIGKVFFYQPTIQRFLLISPKSSGREGQLFDLRCAALHFQILRNAHNQGHFSVLQAQTLQGFCEDCRQLIDSGGGGLDNHAWQKKG